MEFSQALQYLLAGLTTGSVYAVVGIGFNVIYNATGIINFAQGEFLMLGGMIAITLQRLLPLPVAIARLGARHRGRRGAAVPRVHRVAEEPGRAAHDHHHDRALDPRARGGAAPVGRAGPRPALLQRRRDHLGGPRWARRISPQVFWVLGRLGADGRGARPVLPLHAARPGHARLRVQPDGRAPVRHPAVDHRGHLVLPGRGHGRAGRRRRVADHPDPVRHGLGARGEGLHLRRARRPRQQLRRRGRGPRRGRARVVQHRRAADRVQGRGVPRDPARDPLPAAAGPVRPAGSRGVRAPADEAPRDAPAAR